MCQACMDGTCTVHGRSAKPQRIFMMPTSLIEKQRDDLILSIDWDYGLEFHPGRKPDVILGTRADIDELDRIVWSDTRLDAVGRGYYLGAGGVIRFVAVPEWTLDADRVAWARTIAVVTRPIRRLVRWLTRKLDRG